MNRGCKRTRDDFEEEAGNCLFGNEYYSLSSFSQDSQNSISSDSSSVHDCYRSTGFPLSNKSNAFLDKDTTIASSKKLQSNRITTEIHQKTVQLMMDASKRLYFQELSTQPSSDKEVLPPETETGDASGYSQRPYW